MEKTGVKKNVTVPTRALWSLSGLAILGPFSYAQFLGYIQPGFSELSKSHLWEAPITHIGLMWVPVISYLLIAGNVCLVVRILTPLKLWYEDGLLRALCRWFVGGLGVGFVSGAVLGLYGGYHTQEYLLFTIFFISTGLWLILATTLVLGFWIGINREIT